MKNKNLIISFYALISTLVIFIVINFGFTFIERKDKLQLIKATELASKWFDLINKNKKSLGIINEDVSSLKYAGLIGSEFTPVTTSLGNLEAKITAANPYFAAYILSIMNDSGIDSTSSVVLILSGSFPSLSIAALAAIQTVRCDALIFSSAGASMYGANDSIAMWMDYETWLKKEGGLNYSSTLVSYGGDEDNSHNFLDEGKEWVEEAAKRNNILISDFFNLENAIDIKMKMIKEKKRDLLINIGGNHSALGNCSKSSSIPYGYHEKLESSMEKERGIIFRASEIGIPVLHLLNIKNLASKIGFPISPYNDFSLSEKIYKDKHFNKFFITIAIVFISFLVVTISKNTYE